MRVAISVLMLSISAAPALSETLAMRESKFTVKETLDRLAAELDKRGMKVAARIDHAAGAKTVGMEMPPTEVLMFGNPKLGTPLMLSAPSIAIDLPMRMVAWQDRAGKVWIGYTTPDTLKQRHGIKERDDVLNTMAGALDGLAKVAAGD